MNTVDSVILFQNKRLFPVGCDSLKSKSFAKICLLTICLAVCLFSGIKLAGILSEYHKGKSEYDSIAEDFIALPHVPDEEAMTMTGGEEKVSESTAKEQEKVEAAEAEEVASEDIGITVDFEKLFEKYPDAVGWLYCEGTPINYPIVQGADNDYYLNRLPNGEENSSGSIFLDYRCDKGFGGLNSIIYGHNMKNNSMFGSFDKYRKQSYYEEHPALLLLTPECNCKIVLIGGFSAKQDDEIAYSFPKTQEDMRKAAEYAMESSDFAADITLPENFRLVTMSTCKGADEEMRYLLVGYLLPVN